MTCSFSSLSNNRIVNSYEYAVAIFDSYPVSPGHTLIMPKRQIASLFEAAKEERED